MSGKIRINVGAPKGMKVHWLMDELNGEFAKAYKLNYNKNNHNYRYARYRMRTLVDEFIVIRTSKKCYRVMYFNADYNHFIYFTEERYKECAHRMYEIYVLFRDLEVKREQIELENKVKKCP